MNDHPILRLCAAAAALCLCAAASRAQTFEIIALPDTEDYADYYPSIFGEQTQWIVAHREAENIVFVTHVGDVVHHPLDSPSEWTTATDAMYQLDGLLPYGACAGNHDLEDPAGFIARFGASHYSAYGWYGGASGNGLNHFQVFSAGGYDFLHITLQKGPDTATRNWARAVIEQNPGKPTIVSTHDYLDTSGRRTSAGESIWNSLVDDYPQVFMVLCGHNRGVSRLVSTDTNGRRVLQMMGNYQDYTTSGGETDNGYLRKILFDPDNGRISIQTYSPTFAAHPWLTGNDHEFSYDAAFLPPSPGTAASPIFLTDAATCRAAGHVQGFDTTPGPTGTALPLGWTAWQIDGSAGTFSAAHPLAAADIAGAGPAGATLLVVNGPPGETWGNRLANVPGDSGRALATNPGNIAASVLQLKVLNGTGEPVSFLHLYYDLAMAWNSPDDDGSELPGCTLFWSTTGGAAAADWAMLGRDTAAGAKAWDIALPAALEPGADLYLRWADDNALTPAGEAAAEDVWSLDNVRVVMANAPDPAMRGDADADGDVDAVDYLALKLHLGTASGATWQEGDFDHDQDVDRTDLLLLESNFSGASGRAEAGGAAGNVPEPATWTLLALGAVALGRRRRSKGPLGRHTS